ncbi:SatD family protein [Herbiconiux sp. A18JL235]|uniref:SatD family protein n=1 Tax=Herbiconiux sp. A18JL235 TaxID=3152363 RepID=A0AB39BLI3_9MICO
MNDTTVAVIIDIVGSRQLTDRRGAQRAIEEAFAGIDRRGLHTQPIRPTVGDEFQALYPSLGAALHATLLARLALPAEVDCRFGLGSGSVSEVGEGAASAAIQDGPGWWRAREAIVEAHEREDGRTPSARSWFRAADDEAGLEALVNAYLLARDHVIGGMNDRARRVTFATMTGRLQGDIASDEGITQSAVSQALRRSGGASLIATIDRLGESL